MNRQEDVVRLSFAPCTRYREAEGGKEANEHTLGIPAAADAVAKMLLA